MNIKKAKEKGLLNLPQTNIIAIHDLDMIMDLCTRVIIFNNGKIVADGIAKDRSIDFY